MYYLLKKSEKNFLWILIQRFDPIWWILIKLIFLCVCSAFMFTFTSRVGGIYVFREISFPYQIFLQIFSFSDILKITPKMLINYNSHLTFYSAQSSSSQSWNLSEKVMKIFSSFKISVKTSTCFWNEAQDNELKRKQNT